MKKASRSESRRPRSKSAEVVPAKDAETTGSEDVVLVHGVTPDGRGLSVLRQRNDTLETGAIRPLEHGKPIQGEVVRLEPRKEFPLLCDVKVELSAPTVEQPPAHPSRSGPAQVASDRYRRNWDAIWKNRDKRPN